MKQTAVEFLLGHMWTTDWVNYTREEKLEVIEQAKEMEKQQQIDFATDFARDYIGFSSVCTDVNDLGPAAHYYNQKKNKV